MIIVLFVFINHCLMTNANGINDEIKFASVKRVINLKTQLTQITTDIEIVNNGTKTEEKIIWWPDRFGNLSYITTEHHDQTLEIQQFRTDRNILYYFIILPSTLKPMESVEIKVREVFTDALKAFPSEIGQHDHQYFIYNGNCFLYTQYFVKKQSLQVILPAFLENFSPENLFNKIEKNLIQKDVFENIIKFSYKPLHIHYVNDLNFIKVRSIKRNIEISQWGNIAVEENIELYHSGAKLKGGFSRVEHINMKDPNVIPFINTVLPITATDVYYRDDIGNISTSYIVDNFDYLLYVIKFRFPLYGGWRTKYTIGYNLPSYDYLFQENNKYMLSMPVIYHVMHNMHVEHLETNIILPINAKIIEKKFPYHLKVNTSGLIYHKFDQIGRQIIKIEKDNIINDHIKNFEIKYVWNPIMFLYEPILITIILYGIFLSIILLLKLDLSLPIDDDKFIKYNKQFKLIKNRNQIKRIK